MLNKVYIISFGVIIAVILGLGGVLINNIPENGDVVPENDDVVPENDDKSEKKHYSVYLSESAQMKNP